jgi:REP element-mobilizing transposase RayT
MGEYVVMPNHFHAIIGIGKNEYNSKRILVEGDVPKNKFGPQSKNLASIICGFKIGVTKNARMIHPDFKWQSRYHDHIIRNEKSFQRISNYSIDNPVRWQKDQFFKSE